MYSNILKIAFDIVIFCKNWIQHLILPPTVDSFCCYYLLQVAFDIATGAEPGMGQSDLISPSPPFWQLNHANSAYFGAISANFPQFRHSAPSVCKSWIRPCCYLLKIALILLSTRKTLDFIIYTEDNVWRYLKKLQLMTRALITKYYMQSKV